MRVAIVGDDVEKEGGTSQIIKHIIRALDDGQLAFEYVNSEIYFPKYIPSKWKVLYRFLYLRRISKADFSKFDMVITLQPDSHCIRHRNHIVYFQHHIKQYYDLFWQSLNQKKTLKRKIVFVMLAAIVRLADKIYLTPNLKRSNIIVNSKTVGERLKRYNRISHFRIINPGCDIPQIIQSHNQKTVLNHDSNRRDGSQLLLAFSRLDTIQKGVGIILETASILPSCQFIIAGPYEATTKIIDTDCIADNVQIMAKEFSEQEKAELFSRCDAFLAPYMNEDFGITPIEANSYGKAVVYCDDSGEIVRTQRHKGTGFMCRRIPQSIVEGIQFCLRNKEEMKSYCIKNASKYSWDNFEKSFRSYIHNLKLR
jgi:glycosyltransferase involved in cell wall biosynthesis